VAAGSIVTGVVVRLFLAVMLIVGMMSNSGMAVAQNEASANFMMPYCRDVAVGNFSSPIGENQTQHGFLMGMCAGIVAGLNNVGPGECPPAGVTPQQAVAVVVQYIDARPARMHERFAVLALEAMQLAWPCKR
jgi:ammonia channel protein AmtB